MKKYINRTAGLFLIFLTFSHCYAQQGKNGAEIISNANTIVNEYTSLTDDATAGSASLTVSASSLNTNSRFAASLAQGDLVMIIQMQGATINGTATDSTWGAVTNYNNCGLYEFSEVASVPNLTTINLSCPLKNNYTAAGKVQVVRVPRFSSLTIDNEGVLTADAWNGTQGGIVVTEVQGSTTINTGGIINATGLGFRGGVYVNNTSGPAYTYIYNSTDITLGGEQGEGIAGFESDYNTYNGRYCMGAPANGGGGGNAWNCPGGGGSNAGDVNAWTGDGNPDTTNANWIQAWNLEYNGFAYSTSSGGGRGGYGVAYSGLNPLTVGPNSSSWDQYLRASNGGKGGRPLDYSTGRIFFGGGGGAPKADNNFGSSGGNGGGMVYILCYGTATGGGMITANGDSALNAICGTNYGDPPGGGGAGGAVLVYCTGAISNISIYADGGNGGNQVIDNSMGESEGPGGGGGGGYIAISNGSINRQALGGKNGTTNAIPMASFPPDGATIGGAGLANEIISNIPFSSGTASAGTGITICDGDTASLTAPVGTIYQWSPDTGLSCTSCPNPLANPSSTTTYVVQVSSGGSCFSSDSIKVTVLPGAQTGTITSIPDTVCAGSAVQLNIKGNTGSVQWQSSLNDTVFTNIIGADTFTTPLLFQTIYYRLVAGNGMCSDTSAPFTVLVNPTPAPPNLTASDSIICPSDSALITTSGSYSSYLWNNGDTHSYTYATVAGGYWVTVTDAAGCSAVSEHQQILVYPAASVSIVVQGDTLSSFGAVSYQWLLNDTVIPNAINSIFVAKQPGNYAVQITDTNGCTSTSDNVPVFLEGISELNASARIELYPNPSTSLVYISVLDATPVNRISIFNMLGQEVKRVALSNNTGSKFEIDISGLSIGTYEFALFSGSELVCRKKLIK